MYISIFKTLEKLIEEAGDSEYLLGGIVYDTYRRRFVKMCNELGISRTEPHNCRKTFATLAAKYHVDPVAVKRIMGHAITDITEKVYTERSVEWLHEEINKIPVRFGCIHDVDLDQVYRGLLDFIET